ncbi:MFS transporter [Blastococcus sp. TF02-09]|nr:MFS transporter [Blastococcus sp. TF02-9]
MAGAVLSPVLLLIRAELSLSSTAAGLVLTSHALSLALASPLVGWAIDRYGSRAPLAAGLLVYGGAGGAGLVVDSYAALIATRIVFGIGAAAVFTGTTVVLLELHRGARRDQVMGWRTTATSLGGVAWPLLGGALGGLSWQAPFALYLVGIPLGVATWLALPPRTDETAQSGGAGAAADDGHDAERVGQLLRRRPRIVGLCGLLATGTVLLYGLLVLVPLRQAELGVRAPFAVAALSTSMSVAMSVAGLGYAAAVARVGHAGLLRGTYLTWTAAFVALATTDVLGIVVLAQAAFGVGMALALPSLTIVLEDASPQRLRGRVMALSGTAIFLGQFLSPLLLGPVADAVAVTTGFLAAAVLAGAVLVVLLATDLTGGRDVASPSGTSRPERVGQGRARGGPRRAGWRAGARP